MAPWVLHVDMDQFIAAVEILRHPELSGLPVIVGGRGDPTERAVVSTASYEAREFGVRSGMPLKVAVRRCPEAVLLPVDGPTYDEASAVVMSTHDLSVAHLACDDACLLNGEQFAFAAIAEALTSERLKATYGSSALLLDDGATLLAR